jgi:hypothetical protein
LATTDEWLHPLRKLIDQRRKTNRPPSFKCHVSVNDFFFVGFHLESQCTVKLILNVGMN